MSDPKLKLSFSNAVPIKQAIEKYSDLSFPNLRTRIINNKVTNPLIVVMASIGQEVVGLATAARQRKNVSEILTLMVKKDHRRKGIGNRIIREMNKIQAENEHTESRMFFFSHWENNEFLKNLCENHFWNHPKIVLNKFEHDYSKSREKILPSGLELSSEYQFLRWDKMDVEMKNAFHKEIDARTDVKAMFRIGNYTKRLVSELTHVLKKEGVIIGWCIAIKVGKASIEHTLFILPEYRTSPIVPVALINKNWLVQMRSEYSKAVWLIDAKNGSMLRFMKKKLPHLVDDHTQLSFISKEISSL